MPATAVLDWNATTVATVRAATPAKAQIESDLYVSYVQASVYDAVIKIDGRYAPYHDSRVPSRRAGRRCLRRWRQRPTRRWPTTSQPSRRRWGRHTRPTWPALRPWAGCGRGDRAGRGERHHRRPDWRRAGRRHLDAVRGGSADAWRVGVRTAAVAAVGADAWLAVMRPLLLETPDQFRVGPPFSITSRRYAHELDEVETYGSATSARRTGANGGRAVLERVRNQSDERHDRGSGLCARDWTASTPPARSRSRTWSTPTPASHAGTPSTTTCSGGP